MHSKMCFLWEFWNKCAAAGYTYDTEKTTCSVPTCAVNTNGDASDTSSAGCEFIASIVTTPASCEATATCNSILIKLLVKVLMDANLMLLQQELVLRRVVIMQIF